ncbi:MAG: transposase, partial [Planctomycetaceae bacterium]|nr:transposase [Planctomycetaceae bacterium]
MRYPEPVHSKELQRRGQSPSRRAPARHQCAKCGHVAKSNRKSQAGFACKVCGHRAHADVSAARNLRARALAQRALELDDLGSSRKSPPFRAGEA